ncbi:polyphosphate glucokinase [Aneurinibacillus sp. XH2]|uniref:phage portal protein n=1 Tax=Aneurinibacillus sp. XH2 TaxID=1450761 RepID=UPI00070F727A|nr:phage portal protein [Aneurinibacillus sp. XH2]AMA72766.1 polyphosphate glucokinase [Aneurinibacillus sp. XH2]
MQTMLIEQFYQENKENNTWKWVLDVIRKHQTRDYSVMRKYVDGEHDILKQPEERGKPNNRIVVNFARKIIDFSTSYIASNPIRYAPNVEKEGLDEFVEKLQAIFVDNDEESSTYELIENGSIDGEVFEYYYFDEDGQICMTPFTADECIAVYDTTVKAKLIAVIRYYHVWNDAAKRNELRVEVYDEHEISYLKQEGESLVLDTSRPDNPYLHKITVLVTDQDGKMKPKPVVPWTHYVNRPRKHQAARDDGMIEGMGDLADLKNLFDAINKAITGKVNVQEYFKNPKIMFEDLDLDELILYDEEGNLITDVERKRQYLAKMFWTSHVLVGSKAVPITWDLQDQHEENTINRLIESLLDQSGTPHLRPDQVGNAPSGIALKLIFYHADIKAGIKMRQYGKGLRNRLRILTGMLNMKYRKQWNYQDIDIKFSKNMPVNIVEMVDIVTKLIGELSHEERLALLPFVDDPQASRKKLLAEQEEEAQRRIALMDPLAVDNEEDEDENGSPGDAA